MSFVRPLAAHSLPSDAKRVFQGVIFDVYQWQQRGYDGQFRTFEILKRPDTALVVPILEDGTLLYAHQEQPGKPAHVGLLGGRVEPGEDALTAAKRELLEESGYGATDWSLWYAYHPEVKIDWCISVFIAKGCRRIADQRLDGAEKIELRTASLDEFCTLAVDGQFEDSTFRVHFLEAQLNPDKASTLRQLLSLPRVS